MLVGLKFFLMKSNIKNLGKCRFDSPLIEKYPSVESAFVSDDVKVRYNCYIGNEEEEKKIAAGL